MSKYHTLTIKTQGEKFYSITKLVEENLQQILKTTFPQSTAGVLHLMIAHTSCALTIGESFDPSAKGDQERFLKHLVPSGLPFIKHLDEGEDDSPSHIKSMLLQQHLAIIVENKELIIGKWQGIYLAEFRMAPHARSIFMKYQPDSI
ncbi:MAG: YjbQ family protein [Oligoflexia bacterium]|nr:YjbQ family protein [Oligoflexia bacterium]